MSPICQKCKVEFGNREIVDGETKNLSNRKYCISCSPWGKHNTKTLLSKDGFKTCCSCKIEKPNSDFNTKGVGRLQSYCKVCLYSAQKDRWSSRKLKAIELFGGKCEKCGYDKNIAVLEFHHRDPKEKELTWTKMRLYPWATVISELQKCSLFCANCHREVHNPSCFTSIRNINSFNTDNSRLNNNPQPLQSTGFCPTCHNPVYGTKHCSVQCSTMANRRVVRPTQDELQKEILEMPMVAIGKKYGVSDNAVRKWAKQYDIPL